MKKIHGIAYVLGDNINTDIIIPGKYLRDFKNLHKYLFSGRKIARKYNILVCGKNFGIGSSREQAVIAIKHAKIKCIIAKSYAPIFYRNAINVMLPVITCNKVICKTGNVLVIDFQKSTIKNITTRKEYKCELPEPIEIILAGGLIKFLKSFKGYEKALS